MPTITTLLRLADDSTAPITITRRGPCSQWSAVTIDDAKPYICKRGHIIAGRNAALHFVGNKAYRRCRTCNRINKRMSRARHAASDANDTTEAKAQSGTAETKGA